MHHPLHFAIAEELQKRLAGCSELFRDSACGGGQHLSLFVGPNRGRDTHMCDVDLLIISENQVRVIVEMEESGFLPTKICGKFLQSAFATCFIDDSRPEPIVPYGNRVLFVQVLDSSKCLPKDSQKEKQGRLIEEKIQCMLPLKGSGITDYHLFYVQGVEDVAGIKAIGEVVSNAFT